MGLGCANGEQSAARVPARISAPFSRRTIRERRSVHCDDLARRFAALWAIVIALHFGPSTAAAQLSFLDRLQLVSLGVGTGSVSPSQIDPTTVFVLGSDYGEISPAWRVIFRTTYWTSQFKTSAVDAFADTLQKNLADPSATTVLRSPVKLYDVTFAIGARRILMPRSDFTPFFSGGLAAHVINAEGSLINGTFVERSLDNVASGAFAEGGFRVRLVRRLLIEASVRGDLLSAFRSIQGYAMGSYFFGEPRRGGSRP
jgi:hypothetical protein